MNLTLEDIHNKFPKAKKSLTKKFPGAKTKMYNDKFYIVDGNNNKIITDHILYPNWNSVAEAWIGTDMIINTNKMIDRNNKKFSDEKISKHIN